jgi:putative restriction endonuclease
VKLWVGVTDDDWFRFLSEIKPDEVNFWQPSGGRTFQVLKPGELFLFKLHSPNNYIVGGGHFVRSTPLPASLAWEAFSVKNGVATLDELIARVRKYSRKNNAPDPVIGCNVLAEPFFLSRSQWIPVPESWSKNIVTGKSYDSSGVEGAALLEQLEVSLAGVPGVRDAPRVLTDGAAARYGSQYLTRGRLGQGAFRVLVTDAYTRRCAITGERTLPVLQAAHIKPYASHGPHRVSNGLLLRSDLHTLFDRGYLTVTRELKIEVSKHLREDWQNGREYYAHHGKPLAITPTKMEESPDIEFLRWHNESRFLG